MGYFIKRAFLLYFFIATIAMYPQDFLNGDFENNTAGTDQIDLSNSAFNGFMSYCVGFGTNGNLDIITSSIYQGGPQNGNWYIALTGGGTDKVSMKLSNPLTTASQYTIVFYDKADFNFAPGTIDIGISTNDTSFGTLIYSTPSLALNGTWSQRTFSFVAPFAGQYITFLLPQGSFNSNWVQVDNFHFLCLKSPENFQINVCENSTTVIGQQSLSDKEFVSYKWFKDGLLINDTTPTIEISPSHNEIWVKEITACNQTYTDTFFVNAVPCSYSGQNPNIPNVFSPNEDGVNDNFEFNIQNAQLELFEIYNRWGIKVYDISDQLSNQNYTLNTLSWDGHTTSGEPCSEGVYYYIIEFINSKQEKVTYRGVISLFR